MTRRTRLLLLIAALPVLLLVLVGAVYGVSSWRFSRVYTLARPALPLADDSVTLARGEHLATALAKCVDCHGDDLGGKVFIDDPGLGVIAASNLTRGRGGVGAQYSDAQLVRALRDGIRHDGTPLLFMPSDEYTFLADDDLAALLAYVRHRPPVDRAKAPTRIKLLGRALFVAGALPLTPVSEIDHARMPMARATPGATAEYGQYLASTGGCIGCHGPGLSGGHVPGTPPSFPNARNLTPTGLGAWTEADFTRALREGKRPDGSGLADFMPWRYTRLMTDDEIAAIWRFLRTLPPKPTGQR